METDKINITKEQELLIEKLGVVNEKNGIQPAAARVMALLLVADGTEVTFEQIYETLNISKSAASNAINLLLSTDKISYLTKMGDRKRYFYSNVMYWQDDLKQNLNGMGSLVALLNEVLRQRPGNTVKFNAKLKEVIDFIDFLNSELPALYEKWEQRKT